MLSQNYVCLVNNQEKKQQKQWPYLKQSHIVVQRSQNIEKLKNNRYQRPQTQQFQGRKQFKECSIEQGQLLRRQISKDSIISTKRFIQQEKQSTKQIKEYYKNKGLTNLTSGHNLKDTHNFQQKMVQNENKKINRMIHSNNTSSQQISQNPTPSHRNKGFSQFSQASEQKKSQFTQKKLELDHLDSQQNDNIELNGQQTHSNSQYNKSIQSTRSPQNFQLREQLYGQGVSNKFYNPEHNLREKFKMNLQFQTDRIPNDDNKITSLPDYKKKMSASNAYVANSKSPKSQNEEFFKQQQNFMPPIKDFPTKENEYEHKNNINKIISHYSSAVRSSQLEDGESSILTDYQDPKIMNYTEKLLQQKQLWVKTVASDYSFAPLARQAGKYNAKPINSQKAKTFVTKHKLPQFSKENQNLKINLDLKYKDESKSAAQKYQIEKYLKSTNQLEILEELIETPRHKKLWKKAREFVEQFIEQKRFERNQIRNTINKINNLSETDKIRFFINDMIIDARQDLEKYTNSSEVIKQYITEYLLMTKEEFQFLMVNYFRFIISYIADISKPNFQLVTKIKKEYTDDILDLFQDILKKYKLSLEMQRTFKKTWDEQCDTYFKPNNFVENIGGGPRIKKILQQIQLLTAQDLTFSKQIPLDYNLLQASMCLLNDDPYLQKHFNFFIQDKHITQNEFFIVKKNLYITLRDTVLEPEDKARILEKFEELRKIIFPDTTFQSKAFRKDLGRGLFNNPVFISFFNNPGIQDINNFVDGILNTIFGNLQMEDFLSQIQKKLKAPLNDRFFNVMDKFIQDQIKHKPLLSKREVEFKMYRIRFKANIGMTFYSIVRDYFGNVENFMNLFTKFFTDWIYSFEQKYSMLETKAIDMGFLELILRLALEEHAIFSVWDAYWGLDYFAVTQELFYFWIQGLKTFLHSHNILEKEIEHFIQMLQKITHVNQ